MSHDAGPTPPDWFLEPHRRRPLTDAPLGRRVRNHVDRALSRSLPAPVYEGLQRPAAAALRMRRDRGRRRVLPDYLVIGAARSGTTTLHGGMAANPSILPASKKQVHFFEFNYQRGVGWYRSHFPLDEERREAERRRGHRVVTGEASPTYLPHPLVPGRVAETVPDVKLVVVMRNPVDRAYSHYQMVRREGNEPLSFEEAIEAEPDRLGGEVDRMASDPRYRSWAYRSWAYLDRGRYAEQLERWFAVFPRERFLLLSFDELATDQQAVFSRMYAFLGVPDHTLKRPTRLNTAPTYEPLSAETRTRLEQYFRPHNERLSRLIGVDFGWNDATRA